MSKVKYYGDIISENILTTPEGYLVCVGVPIARIGEQEYTYDEAEEEPEPGKFGYDKIVVDRLPEEVFSEASIASFNGKPICDGHPKDGVVTVETEEELGRGHVQNIRQEGDFLLADLFITDPELINEVRNRTKREVSCGYTCDTEKTGTGRYKQVNIKGNHVAIVPKGRAGREVRINDAAPNTVLEPVEKQILNINKTENNIERKYIKLSKDKSLTNSFLKIFGKTYKDSSPEEQEELADFGEKAISKLEEREDVVKDSEPVDKLIGKEQDTINENMKTATKNTPANEPAVVADEDGDNVEVIDNDFVTRAEFAELSSKLDKILEHFTKFIEDEEAAENEREFDALVEANKVVVPDPKEIVEDESPDKTIEIEIEKEVKGEDDEKEDSAFVEDCATPGTKKFGDSEILKMVKPFIAKLPTEDQAAFRNAVRGSRTNNSAYTNLSKTINDNMASIRNKENGKQTISEDALQAYYDSFNPHKKSLNK